MIKQEEFVANGLATITTDQRRRTAFKTYNAYARFIHHLYEFIIGAVMRDRQNTKSLASDMADRYVGSELQRALSRRRDAILDGTAPAWENHISYFPEKIPQNLATDFRRMRNVTSGHVKIERSDLSLSDFYDQHHKYLHMLYRDVQSFWGRPTDEFPDLKEVTAFSVLIKDIPPP